jgi:hypothetical protein
MNLVPLQRTVVHEESRRADTCSPPCEHAGQNDGLLLIDGVRVGEALINLTGTLQIKRAWQLGLMSTVK